MRVNYVRIQKSKNSCISWPLDEGKKIQYRNAVIFYTEKNRGREPVQESSLNLLKPTGDVMHHQFNNQQL
jgi:hypothetical protein